MKNVDISQGESYLFIQMNVNKINIHRYFIKQVQLLFERTHIKCLEDWQQEIVSKLSHM